MKRLGIFVFFDRNGVVSEYVEYLLAALKTVISFQIVVVNGQLQPRSEKVLLRMANKLLIRDNRGFDAGAYKDIFQNDLTESELKKYDEIVLCNDSFYGPIFPFTEVWKRMEHVQADFWGITRHPGGLFNHKNPFPAHIQSYFLVIKKRLFLAGEFRRFWEEEIAYETEFQSVVENFEIKFTYYFEEKGFISAAMSELPGYDYVTTAYNENPYLVHSFELISKKIIPVLKRKRLLLCHGYLEDAIQAYEYVCKQTDYPEHLIKSHLQRLSADGNWEDEWDLVKLEAFYRQHKKVYLYGAGGWSKRLLTYFQYRGWETAGILVSEGETIMRAEQVFSPDLLADTDGIVVALGDKHVKAVAEKLRAVLREDQLFIPAYK